MIKINDKILYLSGRELAKGDIIEFTTDKGITKKFFLDEDKGYYFWRSMENENYRKGVWYHAQLINEGLKVSWVDNINNLDDVLEEIKL